MTRRRSRKIWLGLGAAALIGSGAAQSSTAEETPSVSVKAPAASATQLAQAGMKQESEAHDAGGAEAKAKATGEGGEAGEAGAAGLDPRVKFFRNMGLVRGHLLVGDELVKQGRWDDALPHFHHPIEELYASIRPTLQGQGIHQFDAALKALAQTVKAKKMDAYEAAWKTVDQEMTSATKAMGKFLKPRLGMTMQTVLAMLKSAASEYEEAIENGRLANPVEYQDSRGFVWYADILVEGIAGDLEKVDKDALTQVRAGFTELKKAWPAPVPPETPVKDHETVLADISRIELAASPLLNAGG